MKIFSKPTEISPEQFEKEVQNFINTLGSSLENFQVIWNETVDGTDGEYQVDVLAKFQALGGDYQVLIECKRYTNQSERIKREIVQILNDRLRSTGSQKGMIFSTVGFQSGAIEYAKKNGIALIKIEDGKSFYLTRSAEEIVNYPSWLPDYTFWLIYTGENGAEGFRILDENVDEALLKELFSP